MTEEKKKDEAFREVTLAEKAWKIKKKITYQRHVRAMK